MKKLFRNLAVLIGGSVLLLPLIATVLLFSSSGASDADNENMLLSQLDSSLLQNETDKTAEAFYSLGHPLQGMAGLADTETRSYHLNTDLSKFFEKINAGDLENKGFMTDGGRNRMAQPVAMIVLGAGMIALATLRRKQARSKSQTKPESDIPASRQAGWHFTMNRESGAHKPPSG
jgi:hypothetical protein